MAQIGRKRETSFNQSQRVAANDKRRRVMKAVQWVAHTSLTIRPHAEVVLPEPASGWIWIPKYLHCLTEETLYECEGAQSG